MSKRRAVKEPREQRGPSELRQALVDQVTLLVTYCEQYDAGVVEMALPMATALRVLLHHYPERNSHALLAQLSLRSGRFFTMAPLLNPQNLIAECNLVILRMGSGIDPSRNAFMPVLERLPFIAGKEREPFAEWWNRPVAKNDAGETMSRREIIGALANTDGGAHVDPDLPRLYAKFKSGEFMGWRATVEGVGEQWCAAPQGACIRTIAHELLLTLEKYAPWSFKRPYQINLANNAAQEEMLISGMQITSA